MSTTSDQIKSWFLNSLTARAAYGYFTGDPPGSWPDRGAGKEIPLAQVVGALVETSRQALFTNAMANYFVSRFAVVEHLANTPSGYSGTLFALRTNPI